MWEVLSRGHEGGNFSVCGGEGSGLVWRGRACVSAGEVVGLFERKNDCYGEWVFARRYPTKMFMGLGELIHEQFSHGARMCVGRHIAMIEICKMLPAIMRKIRFELVEPEKEWEILNSTFNRERLTCRW